MMDDPVIGVVGLGTMGLGIAQLYAQAGFNVLATDAHAPARDAAKGRIAESLDARVTAGKLAASARDATLSRITVVSELQAFAPAALVIEAIVEKLEAKQALFSEIERAVNPACVLATNTSSLSVAAIMATLKHPARGVGLHFFNPPQVMKLVELVAHRATSEAALGLARHVTEAAGKTVIACADRPGFIVNRCARPFYGEALALLEEGRTASDVDAAVLAAGYRMGPFTLIDLIGADINLAATETVFNAMGGHPRYHVFAALRRQVAEGNLGRKTGKGFLAPAQPGPPPADAATLVARIEAALFNEAQSLRAEGFVSESDIDTALKLGLNFPRGPFESADRVGRAAVLERLAACEAAAPPHLKGRYVAVSPSGPRR